MSWNSPLVIGLFIGLWILTFPLAWMLLTRLVAQSVSKRRRWYDPGFWALFLVYRAVIAAPYVAFLVVGEGTPNLLRNIIIGLLVTATLLSLLRFFSTSFLVGLLWRVYGYVYDGLNHFYPYKNLLNQIVQEVALRPGETVLELGCGTGNVLRMLADGAPANVHISGVDNSPTMLSAARKKLAKEHSVTLVQSDILKYLAKVPSKSVDHIVLVNVIYAIEDRDALWPELLRVLKPSGRVVATTSDRAGSRQITAEHLANDSWIKLLHPKLVAVGIIDYFISELSRAGAFHFVSQDQLFAEISAAGGQPKFIMRSYGGSEAGVNIVFTMSSR